MALAASAFIPVGPNVAWYLLAAERLMGGATLYVDIIDMNTPMVVYLSVPAALMAAQIGGSAASWMTVFVAFLALAAVMFARSIGATNQRHDGRHDATVAISLALLLLSVPVFGEREHLMAILVMPYIALASTRLEGQSPRVGVAVICGVLAGLGIAIKPYFVFIWIAVEICVATHLRRIPIIRAESLVILAAQLAYYGLCLAVFPDYVSKVVPIARSAYGAFDLPWPELAGNPAVLATLVASVAAMASPASPEASLRRVLSFAAWGALASAFVQAKGWPYHFYPAAAFSMILALACLLQRPAAGNETTRRRAPIILLSAISLAILGKTLFADLAAQWNEYRDGVGAALVRLIEEKAVDQPVFVMASQVWPAFPAVLSGGARWPYRFNSLWILPGVYPPSRSDTAAVDYRLPHQMGPAESFQTLSVVDDLTRHPPKLLVVDVRRSKDGFGKMPFDYVSYFHGVPGFDRLFSTYVLVLRSGGFLVFERESVSDDVPVSDG